MISVDVETSGPYPGDYSILSIGACTLGQPRCTFYVELKPLNDNALSEALAISQLDLDELKRNGLEPEEAMKNFAAWVEEQAGSNGRPVFLAFNAPFDWMFLHTYFYQFLGYNPFGHTALDIKAYFMGLVGSSWAETSLRSISQRLGGHPLVHHALQDAIDQAILFEKLRSDALVLKESP